MTQQGKPKLLVLGGGHIDPGALAETFDNQFELVITDSEHALEALERERCEAVLVPAGEFLPLERQLLTRESTILLNAIGEGLGLLEADGVVLWANERYESYDPTIRRRLGEVARAACSHFRANPVASPAADGPTPVIPRSKRFKLSLKRRDRHFEVLATQVLSPRRSNADDDGGTVARVALAVREVTSRERTRAKIEAINAAGQELVHIESEEVARLHATERLKLLEERIVKYADELLHFDHFAIRMLNPQSQILQVVIARHLSEEAMAIELSPGLDGNGITGWVAASGRSYICPDTSVDKMYVYGLDNPGSSLTVPLKLFDEVIGVFNIESHDRNAFTDQDRQFAEIFANYIAMALHILNLLIVERRATRERATGTVRGELSAPLNDLATEAEALLDASGADEHVRQAVERILADVRAIRKRVQSVSRGAQTVLGLDETLSDARRDEVLGGKRILVVDDDETMRSTIRDVLTNQGAVVVTCESASAAKKLFVQWTMSFDAEEGFDLVISDIDVGDGTGYDVFSAARKADAQLPVILMTGFGYDPHHSVVRASQDGLATPVLFKPFRAEKLIMDARNAIDPASGVRNPGPADPNDTQD